jgi:hypothetical protein
MKKLAALVALTICSFACCEDSSVAQDQFKKLSGPEIRAKFIGMEFTDEVHWGEVYEPNGKLTNEEMGKKRVGTLRIEKNQLCTTTERMLEAIAMKFGCPEKMSN